MRGDAAAADRERRFPSAAFDALRGCGLVADPPIAQDEVGRLLDMLAEIGEADLSVGRVYEGHVNAMLLLRRHGTAAQKERLARVTGEGGVLGVWNTDVQGDPVRLDGTMLAGRKNFSSGVDGLSHAIVTAACGGARQMVLAPLADLPVDRAWWQPLGMRASGSHIVDFTGLTVEPDWLLGAPDDYVGEPWFSAGAIRFAAVQVGGMRAIFDEALLMLRRSGRSADPYQRQRIGRMSIAVQTGHLWLGKAAGAWRAIGSDGNGHAARAIAAANATRSAVEVAALSLIEEVERGIGFPAFMAPHPLERMTRDLRTYLRQPNPDGALASLGSAVADGHWTPGR